MWSHWILTWPLWIFIRPHWLNSKYIMTLSRLWHVSSFKMCVPDKYSYDPLNIHVIMINILAILMNIHSASYTIYMVVFWIFIVYSRGIFIDLIEYTCDTIGYSRGIFMGLIEYACDNIGYSCDPITIHVTPLNYAYQSQWIFMWLCVTSATVGLLQHNNCIGLYTGFYW